MADWTERYRPTTLDEIRGNDSAVADLREWADTWDDHREAVVVHGSPGVGKTSAAHALASDEGWPTIELNASDSRTKDVIERVAGEAARSGTLTEGEAGRRLVVLDEADNLHGNVDRGGTRAITSLVKEAEQPMVLIANEFYDMSQGLRNACRDIEFRDVGARSIEPVLRDICRKEGLEFDSAAIETIAETNSGDLRGAIKDLESAAEGASAVTLDRVVTSDRDRSEGIFPYMESLFKEYEPQEALQSSYDVDETPDDLINWIEDNLPKEYEGDALASAYDFLASADRWLGRVQATQNYSFWRYAGDTMTAGVAAARDDSGGGWTRYGPPSYWSKLGRTSGTRATRDAIARSIAHVEGVSQATARREVVPFLAAMTHHCRNRDLTVAMAARYDMDEPQVAFVTGSGKDTNKVSDIVDDAVAMRGDPDEDAQRVASTDTGTDSAPQTASTTATESDGSADAEGSADANDENGADDSQTGLGDFT
ncbi:replication factor C large subunit [Halococcoides cellulosivorans]|uniref:Replication factor C large subunit n=1 Tax=Halococcoides cellulosivorans TaxID=1679096 RepID=A0A2R4X1A1_9EURY|nr:replication factor C large subunit [Halococcoides cellulosivorans]AWB27568.1 AAA family ATPase [Halococcoides cellulosivorans]